MSNPILKAYDDKVAAGLIREDGAQRAVLPLLEGLRRALSARSRAGAGRLGLSALLGQRGEGAGPRGLYLWGDVGRGKSMLMDLFFESVATPAKRRVHFHAFLRELHAAVHAAQRGGSRAPITDALQQTGQGLRLLALDEMDVSDIGDAMILDRTFRHLLEAGVCIVTTSNRPPGQLYRNGLKRELFVPFITLLETQMQVAELVGPNDWRREGQAGRRVVFHTGEPGFDQLWRRIAPDGGAALTLTLYGRQIVLPEAAQGCAKASFATLCARPLGPADYGSIARAVRVLFIDEVPQLGPTAQDEIRRFVTLIDELYEAGTGLVLRAAVVPDDLVSADMQSEGTRRMVSRLAQMQTADWVERSVGGVISLA